jgi:hypothetical protein
VLKLIYHTGVFGPIDLEYDRPVIRVGRSEENDLVLRHPSVAPYHCVLVFRGENVLWLPPDQAMDADTDLWGLAGPELGPDDTLMIGELRFTLAHSSKTVALPDVRSLAGMIGISEDDVGAATEEETAVPRSYCPHCRVFVPDEKVKRVGLLGHPKRNLCPKCSHLLEMRSATIAR